MYKRQTHDGTSLLETFISDISGYGKTTIVVGTGNEGASGGHTSGQAVPEMEEEIEFLIAPYETGLGLQLWKNYADIFTIALITPEGESSGPIDSRLGPQTLNYRGTRAVSYTHLSVIGSFAPQDASGKCVYCNHCQPCPMGLDVEMCIRDRH